MPLRYSHALLAAVAACLLGALEAAAQPLTYVYWSERDTLATDMILRMPVGGAPSEADTLVTGQDFFGSFDVDPDGGKLYWTVLQEVMRSDLDGARPDTLVAFAGCGIGDGLGSIALDLGARKAYWVMFATPCLYNPFRGATLDGSDMEYLPLESPGPAGDLEVDPTTGKLYWVHAGYDGITRGILRANPDGSEQETIVPGGGPLSLDPEAGHVYWNERGTSTIRRANLDGTGAEDVLTGLEGLGDIALDPDGDLLYWYERGTGTIRRARLDGTGVEDVLTGLSGWVNLRVVTVQGTSAEPETVGEELAGLTLEQNYPNPFAASTTVRYGLDRTQRVRLAVYDVLGREVALLAEGVRSQGTHRVVFDAGALPSGVYLFRLTAGGAAQVRRATLLR